ncbi:hypothetical protein ACOI1H_14730 [Loktanella sp. DJP18]|uniref:hypothetical protein n=1 Tax=Loktanella sp. DJP18 TaxID=3409788 RepID=UPI003BB753B9
MFNADIKFSISIHDAETIAAIKALSPADGLIYVVKGIREIFKDTPQSAYADLRISKQIAQAAIDQGLILLLPQRHIRKDIVEAAATCATTRSLAGQMGGIYATYNMARPSLKVILAIAEAMVASGEAVLITEKEKAADDMLRRIVSGTAVEARARLKGRTFADDVEACEVISDMVDFATDAFPQTTSLRTCVKELAQMGVITITDSAMAD